MAPSDALAELWRRRPAEASTSDAVHATLREAILAGLLRPKHRLGEEELARKLGVSRTPIREAILRLEAERLATRATRRGVVVATVSRDEILELYVVRAAIDSLAARLAAEAGSSADVAKLRWINDQMRDAHETHDWDRMASRNIDFHATLARAGKNTILIELVRMIHDRVRRIPGTTFSVGTRGGEALTEHDRIIDSIAGRRIDEAGQLAQTHMEHAMDTRVAMQLSDSDDGLL